MFDNNQNFNNQNNNSNNIYSNYNVNQTDDFVGSSNINNNVYQGMQPWQQFNFPNNNPSNISNSIYQQQNTVNNSNIDIPPELGDIKNLNEATISSAPTMDVLGPMNIMPESLPNKNDPLEAYENGSLNLNNLNQPANNYQNSFNSLQSNNFNNISHILPTNNFNSNFSGVPLENNINNFSNNINQMGVNNFNLPTQQLNNEPAFNTSITQTNNTPSFKTINDNLSFSSLNNLDGIKQSNNITNGLINETESDNLKGNLSDINLSAMNLNKDDGVKNISDKSISNNLDVKNEEEKDNKSYSIDEDTSLTDLGIEDSYEEPDSLEIMDLDMPKQDEKNDIEDAKEEQKEDLTKQSQPKLVIDDVEKVKSLIEELKKSGSNIELEEFDFEEMYQLIIKFKK